MGNFFKRWRRKIGLLTAAMASVPTVWWLRSLVVADEIQLGTVFGRVQVITSADGFVQWSSWTDYPQHWNPGWRTWHIGGKLSDRATDGEIIDDDRFLIRSGDRTFSSDRRKHNAGRAKGLIRYTKPVLWVRDFSWLPEVKFTGVGIVFSYWTIAGPLILLAVCLLLENSQPSNPKKIVEPIPESVA